MKSRPLPMSTEMIRAYKAGRKGQTRRVIPPILTTKGKVLLSELPIERVVQVGPWFHFEGRNSHNDPVMWTVKCPYGVPGDRLWFKETWGAIFLNENGQYLQWRDTPREQRTATRCDSIFYKTDPEGDDTDFTGCWVTSRFMPRWASRFEVPILSIRAEQVQDISVEDAMNEGLWDGNTFTGSGEWFRQKYAELWDRLNAARGYPWESNPWAWVLTFPFYQGA